MKGAREEWQRSIGMYRLAASVVPHNGNPYNQLAVMSYQSGDELRAVYFYFRCGRYMHVREVYASEGGTCE